MRVRQEGEKREAREGDYSRITELESSYTLTFLNDAATI